MDQPLPKKQPEPIISTEPSLNDLNNGNVKKYSSTVELGSGQEGPCGPEKEEANKDGAYCTIDIAMHKNNDERLSS